jgi:hypothetical protein
MPEIDWLFFICGTLAISLIVMIAVNFELRNEMKFWKESYYNTKKR